MGNDRAVEKLLAEEARLLSLLSLSRRVLLGRWLLPLVGAASGGCAACASGAYCVPLVPLDESWSYFGLWAALVSDRTLR